MDQALERYDPGRDSIGASRRAVDSLTLQLSYSYASLSHLGYLDQAHCRRDEALSRSRRLAHSNTLALALSFALLNDRHVQREPPLVLSDAEELAALSTEHAFPHWEATANAYRGWCLSMLGRAEEGLALQTKATASRRATGALLLEPTLLTMLAEAYGRADRPDEGLRQLNEAGRIIEMTQERWSEGDMHRVRGELLTAIGDPATGEASFRQGLAVARRQSSKLWELRVATGLAKLFRDQGKCTEARDLLAPVYDWFTEGFDTPVLQEAKALLDELA
jgi:predicted ATPase